MSHKELLNKLYKDPAFGLLGKSKFKLKVRKIHPDISNKEIDEFVESQELQQVNKAKPFKGYYKIVSNLYTYQTDIFYLKQYKYTNNNKYIFMIFTDILSKKMFVYPLKSNKKQDILYCLKDFIEHHKVNGIEGDNEFDLKDIKDYLDSQNKTYSFDIAKVDHFSKGNKLGIVDASVRTIKRLIRNYMLSQDTTKYIKELQNLVNNYNDTPHSSLPKNKTPNEIFDDEDALKSLKSKLEQHNEKLNHKIDLDTGDLVRIATEKNIFEKEKIAFSKELYIVSDVDGYKYKVMDLQGNELKRKYKYFELLKVDEDKLENKVNDKNINLSKKKHKHLNKLRNEFGEDIEIPTAKKAQVTKSSKRLDNFEDD